MPEFEEPIEEPTEPVVEPTAEEDLAAFEALTRAERIAYLIQKCGTCPEYNVLPDTERIAVLIGKHIETLEEKALEEKRQQFYIAKEKALEKQQAHGLVVIEEKRVKVYKEKIALEQLWNDAAATGTWDIPI
jgi:hypothetical protein